jgi:hypothetical protein
MPQRTRAPLFLLIATALAAPACGDDEPANPTGAGGALTTSSSTTTTTSSSSSSTGTAGGGGDGGQGGAAPACGDGACNGAETCADCPADCGACPACGDGACNGAETCADCAADCGACPACGDGACNGAETCADCAADCGACPPACGDGACNGAETCADCPADCGACPPVCGDGVCAPAETCQACAADCGACPPGQCTHDLCAQGAPLVSNCDPCVTQVCFADPYCCTTTWDSYCVADAETECGVSCGCSHSVCAVGAGLVDGCSPCVSNVCGFDSSCCDPTLGWEPLCISHAELLCNVNCP